MNAKLPSLLQSRQWDAIVASSPVNVLYLSGANVQTQRLIPDRLALVLWPSNSDPVFIVCSIEESLVRTQSRIRDIRTYTEFRQPPIDSLIQVIKERKLERGRIAIETHHINAAYYVELTNGLPQAKLESCDGELDKLRSVKSEEEIRILTAAALATDKAIAAGYQKASLSSTEKHLADSMRSTLFRNGADEVSFLCLGSGEHSIESHHAACSKKLSSGDIVRVDIGGLFGGYYSDLARTAVVGKPKPGQMEAYRALWDVMEEVIAAVRPGIPARSLYEIYRTRFESLGLDIRMPHVGHSLGMKLHEFPMLTPFEEQLLEANMVLEIELVHITDGSLYHNEDQVVVTANGHEVVSRTANWSRLFEIH